MMMMMILTIPCFSSRCPASSPSSSWPAWLSSPSPRPTLWRRGRQQSVSQQHDESYNMSLSYFVWAYVSSSEVRWEKVNFHPWLLPWYKFGGLKYRMIIGFTFLSFTIKGRVIDYNFYFVCKRNCRVNFCRNIMRELIKYEDTSEFRAGNLALIALVSACPSLTQLRTIHWKTIRRKFLAMVFATNIFWEKTSGHLCLPDV